MMALLHVALLAVLTGGQMPSQAGRIVPPSNWKQVHGGMWLVYWLPPNFREYRDSSVVTPGSVYRSDDAEFRYYSGGETDCTSIFEDIHARARSATYEEVAVAGKQARILHFDDHEGQIYGDRSRPYCAVMSINGLWGRDSCMMMHVLSSTRSGQSDARRIFLSFLLIEGRLRTHGAEGAAQLAHAAERAQRDCSFALDAVARAR